MKTTTRFTSSLKQSTLPNSFRINPSYVNSCRPSTPAGNKSTPRFRYAVSSSSEGSSDLSSLSSSPGSEGSTGSRSGRKRTKSGKAQEADEIGWSTTPKVTRKRRCIRISSSSIESVDMDCDRPSISMDSLTSLDTQNSIDTAGLTVTGETTCLPSPVLSEGKSPLASLNTSVDVIDDALLLLRAQKSRSSPSEAEDLMITVVEPTTIPFVQLSCTSATPIPLHLHFTLITPDHSHSKSLSITPPSITSPILRCNTCLQPATENSHVLLSLSQKPDLWTKGATHGRTNDDTASCSLSPLERSEMVEHCRICSGDWNSTRLELTTPTPLPSLPAAKKVKEHPKVKKSKPQSKTIMPKRFSPPRKWLKPDSILIEPPKKHSRKDKMLEPTHIPQEVYHKTPSISGGVELRYAENVQKERLARTPPNFEVLVYNDPDISLTIKHCSKEYYWAFHDQSIILEPVSIETHKMTSFGVLSSSYLFSIPAFNHHDTDRGNLMVELKSDVLDLPKCSGIQLDRGKVRLLIKNGEAIWSTQGKCVPWDGK